MKMNIILTLSSNDGFGTKIANDVKANMSGLSKIVSISSVRGNDKFLNEILDHQVTRDLKIILVMPEFNGSYPAFFKEWVDNQGWPNRLKDQKIFLIGYSGSFSGNVVGVNHMKAVLDYIDADMFRSASYFTYNGKGPEVLSERNIFLKLIKQFNNE
jgi:NAD(P)H-dependent FMN reductase